MPQIRFVKNLPPITVESGEILMQALLRAGLPVASSCHGDGICARCKILIVEGAENLSQINPAEQILRDRLRIAREVRISCQTRVLGDITVDASYW
jgi:2Fe-2S ferredoxin